MVHLTSQSPITILANTFTPPNLFYLSPTHKYQYTNSQYSNMTSTYLAAGTKMIFMMSYSKFHVSWYSSIIRQGKMVAPSASLMGGSGELVSMMLSLLIF